MRRREFLKGLVGVLASVGAVKAIPKPDEEPQFFAARRFVTLEQLVNEGYSLPACESVRRHQLEMDLAYQKLNPPLVIDGPITLGQLDVRPGGVVRYYEPEQRKLTALYNRWVDSVLEPTDKS